MEDVAHKGVILSLALVEELNEFDTLTVLHDKITDFSLFATLFGPGGTFYEFKVLRNSGYFEVLNNGHLLFGFLDDLFSFSWMRLKDLHSVLNASFLNEFDNSVSTVAKS